MYTLLLYDVVDDYVERRAAFRDEHLKMANAARERGELVFGGAFDDPVDGAALVFRSGDPAVAESFAQADPYVRGGLVTKWRVRKWNVVVGGE